LPRHLDRPTLRASPGRIQDDDDMRLLLAEPRGFCAGVEMAVGALDSTLARFGAPVYAYHHIVHNHGVVADFEARGVVFVDDVAAVPEGATLVFSAHGVSPAVRAAAEARHLCVVDATCPLVAKVHAEARRFARLGYAVILVGHRGHDETVGVTGEAPDHVIAVVESAAEVAALDVPDATRVAFLTQTTLSVSDVAEIVDALRARFPHIVGPPSSDICYATTNRQEAVRAVAGEADVVLVLGSATSSNTVRLVETAQAAGRAAYRVDAAREIQPEWLAGARTVALTAGASVPEAVVAEATAWLAAHGVARVETRRVRDEAMRFRLPLPVRGEVGAGG
jgi:4-hydroxy-3-methylbut-2-enyl diphosphate reductase